MLEDTRYYSCLSRELIKRQKEQGGWKVMKTFLYMLKE
jgi:hypothetical protein